MSEYDQRQYQLMLEQIQAYKSKRITLEHLVAGLESLCGVLEVADSRWKAAFGKSWGILDNAYANIMTKGLAHLAAEEQKLVDDAVGQLKSMVEDQLSDDHQ